MMTKPTYEFLKLIKIEELIEIGFNDSYDSERFKERIEIINILLKKYGLKIQTKFIDANTEPEYRHSLTVERIE
jgi:vesicle coat complex subunit